MADSILPPILTQPVGGAQIPAKPLVLALDSEEWARLIRRRGELIHKKNRQGLTEEERTEYEQLERIVDATMDQRFPQQTDWDEQLAAIESHLASGGSAQE